jgi:heavy metal efflux system protein
MLVRAIDVCLNNRWLVLVLLAGFSIAGVAITIQIPIDAFPDLTNNQVVVITECPGMPPTEVEQLVTFPLESALMGLPKTEEVRSISKLGLSMITLVFDDSVNTYFARQLVNERLLEARTRLPQGIEPGLGPVATAFGEVYQYTVDGDGMSLMDRKTLHDWQIKYQLRTVPGINEVNTWGGESKQYVIEIVPEALQRYGISIRTVFERVRENNANFGGGFIEHAGEQYTVLGLGRVRDINDLEQIVLLERGGTPVLLRDVAVIKTGALPRQGAASRDGRGETVSGMAIMLKGENGRRVIDRVKARLADMRLPDGVRINPFYDQSEVINGTIRTVATNLTEAVVLVAAILLLFLGNIRAALIVVLVIPLSMLFGFAGMAAFGVTANLMSLGALDFGMIVDGGIVMVENSVRRLSHRGNVPARETIRLSAHEVARPIVFGVAIIIAVYLPILYLEGLEGRMFRPMAVTVCSALLGSLVLALFVVPVLASLVLEENIKERRDAWFERVRGRYRRTLEFTIRHSRLAVTFSALVVAAAIASLMWIGTEFMPRLDEGSVLVQTRKLPGISLSDSIALSTETEKVLLGFPEVRSVVSKLGRPDLATEAMGTYEADVYVLLTPQNEWKTASTKEGLINAMAERLDAVPGVANNFTQPMAMRLDETVSGTKADVAIKIFGEDSQVLEQLADRALRVLRGVPGAADAQAEVISGVAELRVDVDRPSLARYGLDVTDVREVLDSTTGGIRVSEMIEGQRRFPITIRLPERYRTDTRALGNLVLQASGGERVRLNQVASIHTERGPEVVSRENAQRRIVVQANVRGTDLGTFVERAQRALSSNLTLPPGYFIEWGGQFENQARAMKRLAFVLPVSVLIILGLLFAMFKSIAHSVLILFNVPFALVGGIAALWLRGLNLNLSASVGFIALFGVAVLNGIVMVSYINQLRREGLDLEPAVIEGASMRLRPVLMTALVASLGFLPMAMSTRMGSEVQRPLATVVIGGLITSTLLTLYILPALYPWFSNKRHGNSVLTAGGDIRLQQAP